MEDDELERKMEEIHRKNKRDEIRRVKSKHVIATSSQDLPGWYTRSQTALNTPFRRLPSQTHGLLDAPASAATTR